VAATQIVSACERASEPSVKTQRAQIPRVRNGGEDDTSLREIAGSVRVMLLLFLLLEESCDSIRKIHKSLGLSLNHTCSRLVQNRVNDT
jgi:hypothetical protein